MSEYVTESVERLAEVLAAHRYRDVLGDYEVAPYYKHFGCSCGWEQNIAGMNGWQSWIAAHEAHAANALLASDALAQMLAEARAEALRPIRSVVDRMERDADSWGACSHEWVRLEYLRAALAEEEEVIDSES